MQPYRSVGQCPTRRDGEMRRTEVEAGIRCCKGERCRSTQGRQASWPRKLVAPWVADDCVDTRRKVLLVSGSLRAGSTNSALLRTAVRVAPAGVEAELFDGVGRLPHFDPDQDGDPLHPAVEALRAAIRGCGSILFSTLEYAGALPGAFKNLLEWAVGDADVGSIYDKPVGWINVLACPTGAADAYRSLAIVLGYVHAAVVPEACVRIPVTRQMVGSEGLITDPVVRESVTAVLDALVISMGCWPSSKSCTCARTCATEASARRCCSTRWSCAASGTQERCTSTPTRSTLTPGASTSVTGS